MSAAAFRLLSFVALSAAAAALWLGFVHSSGTPQAIATGIPPVGSQSIFVPPGRTGGPPAGTATTTVPATSPPAPASLPATEQAARTIEGSVTNHACASCAVHVLTGGIVQARMPGGSGHRHAYALLDLGASTSGGHVLAHDVIGFGRGQSPVRPLTVLQLLDASHRVIFELVAHPNRRLFLSSPAGGLGRDAIDLSTGAVVPNDGVSGVAVDVSARVNGPLAVYVDGVRTVSVHTLAGGKTDPPRYLATGVIGYTGSGATPAITANHSQVSVSTAGTATAAPVTVAPAPGTPPHASHPAPAAAALTALTAPAVSGRGIVGNTLTATPGSWSEPAAAFSYAWQRCDASGACTAIDGATDASYRLVRADRDAYVRVRVTARAGGLTGTKSSAAVGPIMRAAPTALAQPTLAGDPVVGKVLTAGPGTWSDTAATFVFVWQRCDAAGVCTPIDGAAGATYTPTAADVGASIRVEVTATNAGGSGTADSEPTATVAPAAPVVAGAPALTGDATVGSTLTADPGSWSDPAATFTYAWQRCDDAGACTAIDGATGSTYTLAAADAGFRIQVLVTAANAGGAGTASSAPTAPIATPVPVPPAANGVPSIDGTAFVGATLTARPGTWSDPTATFTFAWQRCDDAGACTAIDGATGSTYTLAAADVGAQIRVEVTATGVEGTIGSADSPLLGPVAMPAPPSVVAAPSIAGDPTAGSTLTASPGTWSAPTPSFAYAWQRCDDAGACSPIDGAVAGTYTLSSADVGHRVRVEIAATNAGGSSTADSPTSAVVTLPAPPAIVTPPTVSGSALVGSTLTATPGTWSTPPPTASYAWQRCDDQGSCSPIPGATGSSYTIAPGDVGARIRVEVTAANPGGASIADSAAGDPVALPAAPSVVSAPSVSGDATVGATLHADAGTWSGPTSSFSYAWERCDSSGSCTAIDDATGSSYELSDADLGAGIRVAVTATGPGGQATAVSSTTAAVSARPDEPASSQS